MSLPSYPSYKDSRVSWLGKMPTHWQVCRYKQVFVEREQRSETGQETLLSVSAYTGVSPRSELVDDGDYLSRAESLEGYKTCCPNDLVVNIMLAWNRGLGISTHSGIVSPSYAVFQTRSENDPRFLDYMVRSDRVILYYKAFSSGVMDSRLRLYPDAFGSLHCVLPPLPEQLVIAAFLDRETSKIDALIEAQEKLIALLHEKRQATVYHIVTGGTDPNAPTKYSGVPWLGNVPAHWKVGKAGFYASVLPGYAFSSNDFSRDETCVKLLRGINVGVGEIRWDEVVYWRRTNGDGLAAFELQAGDVVIGMDRPLISSGIRVAIVKQDDLPCLLLQRVAKVGPGTSIDSQFILRLLGSRAFEAHFAPETTGVSVPHLSGEQISNFVIPIPPFDEQRRICDFIEAELAQLDALNREAGLAIVLLRERRSALITAAVTGQIDVRGAVPQPVSQEELLAG